MTPTFWLSWRSTSREVATAVKGASYAIRAAEQAMGAYAAEEALIHFKMALSLMRADDERRGELLLRLGEAASLAGKELEAVAAFTEARERFDLCGERSRSARAALLLGRAWWRQEAITEARAAFETARELLRDHPGPALVEVLVDLASVMAVSQHELEAGIALARQALRLAELIEEEQSLAAANRTLGNLLVRVNQLPDGIALLEKALDLARRLQRSGGGRRVLRRSGHRLQLAGTDRTLSTGHVSTS